MLMTARLHPDDLLIAEGLFARLAAGERDIDWNNG